MMDGFFTDFQMAFISSTASRNIFLVLTAAAVILLIMASQLLVRGASDPVRRRLNELTGQADEPPSGLHMRQWAQSAQNYVLPKNESERRKIHARLIQAGWYSESAIWLYYGVKLLITVLLPLFVVVVFGLAGISLSFQEWLFSLLFCAVVGVLLPNWFLKKAIEKRHRQISNAIPDTLDLLILCLEVGLGIRSAIQRVSSDLFISHPALAHELGLVNSELKAGASVEQALEHLGRRIDMKELDGLVSTLVDSIRYGTSIADTLRAFSADLRDKRVQSAEEQAEKISTKMIFPIVLLLLPAFFIIAAGPAILRLVDVLSGF